MKALLTGLVVLSLAMPASAHQIQGTEVIFDAAIPCTIACSYWIDNGFTPCEAPFPPGSYVDRLTTEAPSAAGKITVLDATLDPEIDWDMFFCRNDETRAELSPGACICLPAECQHEVGWITFGCHEDISAPVVHGQTVIMRAYNWFDVVPAMGRYRHLLI